MNKEQKEAVKKEIRALEKELSAVKLLHKMALENLGHRAKEAISLQKRIKKLR